MTKRIVTIVLMSALFTMGSFANDPCFNRINFIVKKMVRGSDNPVGGEHEPSRSPIRAPYVSIEGHVLDFSQVNYDTMLYLLNDNEEVVFTLFVPASTTIVKLPDTLEGEFEICLHPDGGSYYFCGYVTL